jgi:hypothetical protein
MSGQGFRRVALGASLLALGCMHASAGERLPVLLVSDSPAFDRACVVYYRQGNDPDVSRENTAQFCSCLAGEYAANGLGADALDFFARTLSEDLTTFIDEYPQGDEWMRISFAAETNCKNADYGDNAPPAGDGSGGQAADEPNPPPGPIEAASWGGIVRDGPGQNHRKLGTLEEGEHVMLIENTGIMWNGYPWWRIEFRGSREGYQWGGILCSLDEPMEGIYETCQ